VSEEQQHQEQKIARPEEQRGIVADTVTSVVSGVSGGVAGALVTQGMAKLSGDKSKGEKKD
jgi:hypothetical protein